MSRAFEGCENIEALKIPEGIIVIGAAVFANCRNLSSVSISASLKALEANSFYGSKNLKEIDLSTIIDVSVHMSNELAHRG